MKLFKQIRNRPTLASFQEFTADPSKYQVEQKKDYSLQGARAPSKLVMLVKEIARKKNLGR